MGKKHMRYTRDFKRKVVLMMKTCENIPKLARELGLYKNQLYKWRLELAGLEEETAEGSAPPDGRSLESRLKSENRQLKESLAEKVLQTDFFRSALRRVETASQTQNSGGPAFTPKSGPGRSSKAD